MAKAEAEAEAVTIIIKKSMIMGMSKRSRMEGNHRNAYKTLRFLLFWAGRISPFFLHNVGRLAGRPGFSDSYYTTSALGLAPRPLGLGPLVDMIKCNYYYFFNHYSYKRNGFAPFCDALDPIALSMIPVIPISIIYYCDEGSASASALALDPWPIIINITLCHYYCAGLALGLGL